MKLLNKETMANEEYLLIDGYNIIHSFDELKDLVTISLESSRKQLLELLCNYQGITEKHIIVVFDAHKVPGNKGKIEDYNNIKVVYTKEAQTADSYIEEATNKLAKKYKVFVATSDYLEQLIILGYGAIRISARELQEDIKSKKKHIEDNYIENRPIKNNMILDNLDAKTVSILEKMRRGL